MFIFVKNRQNFHYKNCRKILCIQIVFVVCALCTSFCSEKSFLGVYVCVFNVFAVFTNSTPQIFIVILCCLYPPQAVNTSMPEQLGMHDSYGPYIENYYKLNRIEESRIDEQYNVKTKIDEFWRIKQQVASNNWRMKQFNEVKLKYTQYNEG